jgi:CO dehydrogenase maturation factor
MVLRRGELVLLDMGAGIEHLTRGTARGVDLMVVVTEPGRSSADTAETIGRLARAIGVREVRYVGNKIRRPEDLARLAARFGDRWLGHFGVWDEVLDAAALGTAVSLEGGFGQELESVADRLSGLIRG